MRKSKYTAEQIAHCLTQSQAGVPRAEASASAAPPRTSRRSARAYSLRSARRQVSGWKKSDVR
jgi:hypothetical protein